MKMYLALISLVMLITGVVFAIRALKYKTEKHPDLSSFGGYHPRNWIPFWEMKFWFTPKGYKLNIAGITLIVLSSLIMIMTRYYF
ncbi:MAG: hypothetical protein ACT6FE_05195 [Methanosarcinaceae archaeon]